MAYEDSLPNQGYGFDSRGEPILRKFDPSQLPANLPKTIRIIGSNFLTAEFAVVDNASSGGDTPAILGWTGPAHQGGQS